MQSYDLNTCTQNLNIYCKPVRAEPLQVTQKNFVDIIFLLQVGLELNIFQRLTDKSSDVTIHTYTGTYTDT